MPEQQQEPQGAHPRLSPHTWFSLAACSHLGETLCSVIVFSLQELSCWWSCRARPALTPQWAPPELSHCSGRHLGRVLPGHLLARQDVLCWVGPAGHCWHQAEEAKLCHCFLRRRHPGEGWCTDNTLLGVLGGSRQWTMCCEPGVGLQDGRAELAECLQLLLVPECVCEGWAVQ